MSVNWESQNLSETTTNWVDSKSIKNLESVDANAIVKKSDFILTPQELNQQKWETPDAKLQTIRTDLSSKKDYLKTTEEFNNAMSPIQKWFDLNVPSVEKFRSLLWDWTKNLSGGETKDLYDLLSKWKLSTDSLTYNGAALQSLLSKVHTNLKSEMEKNGWIDAKIGNYTLNAVEMFISILDNVSKEDDVNFGIVKYILWIWAKPLETKPTDANLAKTDVVESRERSKQRLELHTSYDFSKIDGKVAANTFAKLYEQVSYDNLDKSISYDWDKKIFSLTNRDGTWKVTYDDKNKSLGFYWDTGSLFLKDPFAGSVLEWNVSITKYEGTWVTWEPRIIQVKSLADLENAAYWKGDVVNKITDMNISLAGWAVVLTWGMEVDGKNLSNFVENGANGMLDWVDNILSSKNTDDFQKYYRETGKFFDKLSKANDDFGKDIDYKNMNVVVDPSKLVWLLKWTWIFKAPLNVVKDLMDAIWPISMNGTEIKDLVDTIWVAVDTKKYDTVTTDKASRKLVDILVDKTTKFDNANDLVDNTVNQIQSQTDFAKTLAVKSLMYNMMKNGENVVMLWNIAEGDKSGLVCVRLNSIDNDNTWLFAFVEHSGNDIYITPFKKKNVNLSVNAKSIQMWWWIDQKIYQKNWLKISSQFIAKYMEISGMNLWDTKLNTKSGSLNVWQSARNIWYKWWELDAIKEANVYLRAWVEKQWKNYYVEWGVAATGGMDAKYTDSHKMQYDKGVQLIFDAKWFYEMWDTTLTGSGTMIWKNNVAVDVSVEQKINDNVAVWGQVTNMDNNRILPTNEIMQENRRPNSVNPSLYVELQKDWRKAGISISPRETVASYQQVIPTKSGMEINTGLNARINNTTWAPVVWASINATFWWKDEVIKNKAAREEAKAAERTKKNEERAERREKR